MALSDEDDRYWDAEKMLVFFFFISAPVMILVQFSFYSFVLFVFFYI